MSKIFWDNRIKNWDLIGPPMKPCEEDINYIRKSIKKAYSTLILGATPQLVELASSISNNSVCVDISEAMSKDIKTTVVIADWSKMPLMSESYDLVLGDGILSVPPEGLSEEIYRVMKNDGRLFIRCFMPPSKKESAKVVLDDFENGKTMNFSEFRWKLMMSMMDENYKTTYKNVWNVWFDRFKDDSIFMKLGLNPSYMNLLTHLKDSDFQLTFYPKEEIVKVLNKFKLIDNYVPSYPSGECYQTLCFKK